ncbi:DNA polymerase phi-domain-containing protein [Terfezia claveryi]|nr:DNA polymerase phi-domain-containing protein [Terfezia claveryi]
MLHLYKPLTSNDPSIRLKAASELTSQLLALPAPTPTFPTPSRSPKHPKEELHYALTRLIRGLASGLESARFGFAVVLTEYLSSLLLARNQLKWTVSVELVLGLVHKHMEITEHLSRLEERDRWLGRLFGLKAIIMSGCLFQVGEGGVSQERELRTVMGEILDLGREKSWLREPGMWTVIAAARKFGWGKNYLGMVWKMVVERGLAKTSEGVGVWLCFDELCPGQVEDGRIWGEGRWGPLVGGNLPFVARVLKESGAAGGGERDSGGGNQGKGNKGGKGSGVGGKGVWNPKLHWVWDEIIRIYLDSATPKTTGEKKMVGKEEKISTAVTDTIAPFSQFWLIVVDESLFSASSSEERKFHGFLLLIKLFNLLTSTPQYVSVLLPHLFTRNLLRCIINHLSDPSRYLHKSAAKAISTIQKLATAQPSAIPYIVKGLVLGNGTTGFDQLTKTKTVEKLLPLAGDSEDALREVVEMFRDIIVTPPLTRTGKTAEDEDDASADESAESKRQWAADQILSFARSGKGKKHDSWTALVVELFAVLGHFDVTKLTGNTKSVATLVLGGTVPAPKVSEASRSMFRARLSSVLGHSLSLKVEEMVDEGTGLDRDTWPYRAVRVVREVMAAGGVLAMEFDEQIEEAVGSGWRKLESIRAKRAKMTSDMVAHEKGQKQRASGISHLQAFELLYSLVLLQAYNGDSDAVELLEELEVCYGKIMKEKAPAKEIAPSAAAAEESVDASAILVDLILSFLAKPSMLLRKIAGTVWSSFVGTSAVGKSALDVLMEVLETKESFMGQQALFDKEDEGVGEDDDDDDGVKQPVSVDVEEDEDSDGDMATPTSGESDEETDLPTDDETSRFEEALGKALKTKKVLSGQTGEPESDSDADMTDSEMIGLDKHLSIIFRERIKKLRAPQSKKKERADARENVIVFKGKVVELLEWYVKVRFGGGKGALGDGGLFLACVVPRLLAVMRITGKPQLREKVAGVLRLFVREAGKGSTAGGTEAVGVEELWKTLMRIHEEVLREGGGAGHTAACSMGSIAVVKALIKAQQSMVVVERITMVYAGTMTKWLLSGGVGVGAQAGNTLQIQSFFTDFVGWGGSMRKAAALAKKENWGSSEQTMKVGGTRLERGIRIRE